MRPTLLRLAPVLLLSLAAAGCGGGKGPAEPPGSTVTVTLDRDTATVTVLRQRTFEATVTGAANGTVTWSVEEGAAGGTVDASGTYTAPATPGTYHVVASSVADPGRRATATVQALAAPEILGFTASPAEVLPGAEVTLTATFAEGTAVLNPGMVPVTSGAPLTVHPDASTVYVLSVTNAAGTTVAAGAAVTVAGEVSVGVLPAAATVEQGTTLRLAAIVGGTTRQAVTWRVLEPDGGTVAADGTYTPPTRGGTFHVAAASALDPSREAAATITVPRAWQPAQVLGSTAPDAASTFPVLRGNDAGDLLVVYLQGGSVRSRFQPGATGAWGAEQDLGAASDFTLGNLHADGTGWALLVQGTELRAARWSGAGWEPAELVATLPAPAGDLRLASTADGTALAAWLSYGATVDVVASSRSGGTWSAPQAVDARADAASGVQVALRPGLGWIAWGQSDGAFPQAYAARWEDGAFSPAEPRSSTPPAGYPRLSAGPWLGMVDDGTTSLVWRTLPALNAPYDLMGSTFTSSWSPALAVEQGFGAVAAAAVASRGATLVRFWSVEAGSGLVFTDGNAISPLAPSTGGSPFVADVAGTGRALLVWHEAGVSGQLSRLAAVPYDRATASFGERRVLASYVSSYFAPQAAAAADGRATTAWSALAPGDFAARVQVRQFR